MCGLTDTIKTLGGNQIQAERDQAASALRLDEKNANLPVETFLEPPSLLARYTCASIMVAIFAVWGNYTFVGESQSPGVTTEVHSYKIPVMLTAGYLISLQILKIFAREYLSEKVDVKLLLMESMILYNMGQVALNAWMVYKFLSALYHGHPIVGDIHAKGATYAVWVHYCDKYLEFFDTYFMVLRGKMDQVSFLHVYHHATIAWAWWAGITLWPGGDAYFGALLNSWIHVMMYSYYALSLLKISCPWKKYLTQAQLLQFAAVVVYSGFSVVGLPPEANWKHYCAHIIQVAEMISLFILFMHFYNKAYNKRKIAKKERECSESDASTSAPTEQASVSSIITGAASEQVFVSLTSTNNDREGENDMAKRKSGKNKLKGSERDAATSAVATEQAPFSSSIMDAGTEQASVSSDITDSANEQASISSASTDDAREVESDADDDDISVMA